MFKHVFIAAAAASEVSVRSAILIGVVTGILSFLVSNTLWNLYLTRLNRIRLTRILIFECAATVNKLSRTIKQIDNCAVKCDNNLPKFDDVCRLYSGFPVSPPFDDAKELIRYVKPIEASLVGFFYDRWSTLRDLETRYAAAHQRLIEAIAYFETGSADAKLYELLAKEYVSQVTECLRALRRSAVGLCHYSCKLFQQMFSASNLGRNFALIKDHSNGRWKTWADFQKDEEGFEELYKKVLSGA